MFPDGRRRRNMEKSHALRSDTVSPRVDFVEPCGIGR